MTRFLSHALKARLRTYFFVALIVTTWACETSTHQTRPADYGTSASGSAMVQPAQTQLKVTRVDAARWEVDRAGLLNLEHPRAQHAGVQPGPEPIVISFWVIDHPSGRYLIDSGVAGLFSDRSTLPISALVATQFNFEAFELQVSMREWIAKNGPIAAVFLTHMHVDHIMGIPDILHSVPVFSGPGEADARDAMNLFLQSTVDSLLADRGAIREWQFEEDPDGRFEGVIDVFGDSSFFAIHVPGHTPGNTAYLARAVDGDHLIVGDASHTNWGWEHCVEPGEFSADSQESAASLKRLRALADELEEPVIHVGHQHHDPLPTSQECE